MEGIRQLFKTMNAVRGNFDPRYVRDLGLLLTFVEDVTLLSRDVQQQMREYFGDLVYETIIHKNVKLAEAPSAGEPILTYAAESRAAAEYRALAHEITDGRASFDQIKSLVEEITVNTTSAGPTTSHEVWCGDN
jgi:chromosome partitioning protein